MTLQSSGQISLYDVAVELEISSAGINLNDSRVRKLAEINSGYITLYNLYGKTHYEGSQISVASLASIQQGGIGFGSMTGGNNLGVRWTGYGYHDGGTLALLFNNVVYGSATTKAFGSVASDATPWGRLRTIVWGPRYLAPPMAENPIHESWEVWGVIDGDIPNQFRVNIGGQLVTVSKSGSFRGYFYAAITQAQSNALPKGGSSVAIQYSEV